MTATKKAPTRIVDRKTQESALLGGTHELCEMVMPVEWAEGRERCGMGNVTVTGGLALGRTSYYQSFFVAETGDESEWRNYGAPSGTRVTVSLRWVPLPGGPSIGCAGWYVTGREVTADEVRRIAVEMAAAYYAAR